MPQLAHDHEPNATHLGSLYRVRLARWTRRTDTMMACASGAARRGTRPFLRGPFPKILVAMIAVCE